MYNAIVLWYLPLILAPAILPPGEETETECEEDDFRYFQINCPVFSTTIIVEQIDVVGHCAIYVSITRVNPGPLDSPTETIRDETLNVNRRRLTINIPATTTVIVSWTLLCDYPIPFITFNRYMIIIIKIYVHFEEVHHSQI